MLTDAHFAKSQGERGSVNRHPLSLINCFTLHCLYHSHWYRWAKNEKLLAQIMYYLYCNGQSHYTGYQGGRSHYKGHPGGWSHYRGHQGGWSHYRGHQGGWYTTLATKGVDILHWPPRESITLHRPPHFPKETNGLFLSLFDDKIFTSYDLIHSFRDVVLV